MRFANISNEIGQPKVPEKLHLQPIFTTLFAANKYLAAKNLQRYENCHIFRRMNLWDFVIIYLSLSAPFLVYFYHQMTDQADARGYFRLLGKALAWPFFGSAVIFAEARKSFVFNDGDGCRNGHDKYFKAEELFAEIESALLGIGHKKEARRGRFLFDQYCALSIPIALGNSLDGFEKEFFTMAAHKNENLASICLRRRNLGKLFRHQINARLELAEFIRPLLESDILEGKFQNSLSDLVEILELGEVLTQSSAAFSSSIIGGSRALRESRRNYQWRHVSNLKPTTNEQTVNRSRI